MSTGVYSKQEFRFDVDGLGLSTPTDQSSQDERFPILVNVRTFLRGTIKARPGLNSFLTSPASNTPWHSLRRLNDRNANDYTYVAGINTILASGKSGTLTSIDTGYSGNPLSMLPYRPPQSSNEWMAVADTNKMRKVKYDGTLRTLGYAAPTVEPTAELDYSTGPLIRTIDAFEATTGWGNGAGAETPGLATRVSTTIGAGGEKYAGYDPNLFGSTGWYALPLASLDNITPGTLLTAANGATMLVEEVHPASPSGASCTVERVIGDNGTTSAVSGWMWIVPSIPMPQIKQHAYINAGGDRMAAIDVVKGIDGKLAIRCYLGVGSISAGDALTVEASVYGYLSTSPTSPVTAGGVQWLALDASSTNNLVKGSGGSPLNLDLSTFSSGGRAITEEDEVCAIMYLSNVTRAVEIKLEADVNDGTFGKDYYTRSIAPDEFIDVTQNETTAVTHRTTAARRRRIDLLPDGPVGDFYPFDPVYNPAAPVDQPGAPASRTSSGSAQWFMVRFKVSDWKRVGKSENYNLRNIIALRIVVIVSSGGTVDFKIDDWGIIGGYEPDITKGSPYYYRYRYRDSSTGERSNWSPPSRSAVMPHRYQTRVTCTASAVTGIDKIDIQRFGGTVNEWRTIATISNSSATFQDVYSDVHALGVGINAEALEDNVNAQPFTIARGPLTIASGLTVAGPVIYDGTGRFDTSLEQGTPVIANGVPTLVYRVRSANVLEVYSHCGQSSNASLEIPQQRLVGQPLPVIFGTMDGWSFATGDTYNPGRLYFFNHRTLGSTRGSYWIDVSDSSEALLNGCVFNGSAYVWTSEHMYVVTYTGDEEVFRSDPITSGAGLYARWALTVGDAMYWLGKDGIYSSDGGAVVNIVRRDLLPLFSNEGQTGVDTNTIASPNMPQNASTAQIAALRLSYAHNKYLYFDYQDGSSNRRTLVLDRKLGEQGRWGWYQDVYTPGAVFHYPDEGEGVRNIIVCGSDATTARAYTLGGSTRTDNGTAFNCQVRSFALDGGDLRTEKLFGDGFVDVDPANGSVTPTFYFNDLANNIAGSAITGTSRVNPPVPIDFNAGNGEYSRNIAVNLAWSVNAENVNVTLYGWGFSVMGRPEATVKRATDFSDLGHWGPKELKGVSIEFDSEGVARDFVVEYMSESGILSTITPSAITASEKTIVHVSWTPVVCFEARIKPTDTDRWRFFEVVKWHYEPLTNLSTLVGDWYHFGRAVWVQGVEIDGDTNNIAVNVDIQRDFEEVIRTITGAVHNKRGTKAYSFNPPFIAYMVRTAPQGAFRRMSERWIATPEAPIGTMWWAQEFELGQPYGFAKELEVEYAAGATVTLKYYVDGVLVHTDSTTLTSTGSTDTFTKKQVELPAKKGRLARVSLECSTGVRVRQNGTQLLGKSFGGDRFNWLPILGDEHGYGAKV